MGTPARDYGAPTASAPANDYGAPTVSSPENYGAPAASAAEEYGAPAADNYGGPSDNYDYDYNDTPAQAPNSYEAAQPASDTYLAADDAFQSPSAPASDIYDAPASRRIQCSFSTGTRWIQCSCLKLPSLQKREE